MLESHFYKVVTLRPSALLKKRLRHRCFHVNFAVFKSNLFTEQLQTAASASQMLPAEKHSIKFDVRTTSLKKWKGRSIMIQDLVFLHVYILF